MTRWPMVRWFGSGHDERSTPAYLIRTILFACVAYAGLASVSTASAQDEALPQQAPPEPAPPKQASEEQEAPRFILVCHAENPTTAITVKDLKSIFTKRLTRWKEWKEVQIRPIDRERGSKVRNYFTRKIHGKSVDAIEIYWQHRIFSGRGAPPHKLTSDQEVLEFVRANRGAIGYVSPDVELGEDLKELKISD